MSTRECFRWSESFDLTVDIFGTNKIIDRSSFFTYINSCIVGYLNKYIDYKSYIVVFKVFNGELSSSDHYKKIWRSGMLKDIEKQIEEKNQIYAEHFNCKLYLGMAEIKNKLDFDYSNTLCDYSNMMFVFFSENEYSLDLIEPILFSKEKKTPEINYQKICDVFCKNGDTVLRLGLDEYGGEIEIIYNKNSL